MNYEVKQVTVRECPTAVVVATTTRERFPTLWKELLDQVWAFLAGSELRTYGHNIMLYRETAEALYVEVGVQVSRAFESSGAVVASRLPGGAAATTTHRGSYKGLGSAHRAVVDWCAAEGLHPTGTCWEIYGHWRENADEMETEVYWSLA